MMRKASVRRATILIGCALVAACAKKDYFPSCSPPDSITKSLAFPSGMPAALLKAFKQRVGDIAAPDEKFDATDVVIVGRKRKVIFVWNRRGEYVIATERGGIAYNNPVFLYRLDARDRAATLMSEKVAFPTSRHLLGAP